MRLLRSASQYRQGAVPLLAMAFAATLAAPAYAAPSFECSSGSASMCKDTTAGGMVWTVPAGVSRATFIADGAQGGPSYVYLSEKYRRLQPLSIPAATGERPAPYSTSPRVRSSTSRSGKWEPARSQRKTMAAAFWSRAAFRPRATPTHREPGSIPPKPAAVGAGPSLRQSSATTHTRGSCSPRAGAEALAEVLSAALAVVSPRSPAAPSTDKGAEGASALRMMLPVKVEKVRVGGQILNIRRVLKAIPPQPSLTQTALNSAPVVAAVVVAQHLPRWLLLLRRRQRRQRLLRRWWWLGLLGERAGLWGRWRRRRGWQRLCRPICDLGANRL